MLLAMGNEPVSEGVKSCRDCGRTLPVQEFYAHRAQADGRLGICRDCSKARNVAWRAKPDNRRKWNRGRHKATTTRKHGLTGEEYERLYEGTPTCAGCGVADDGRTLAIDHCHDTGKVRGLLCRQCNLVLGNSRDNPLVLRALADYLDTRS